MNMASEKQFGEIVPERDCALPRREVVIGRHVRLLPMQPGHADGLFKALGGLENSALYDYIPKSDMPYPEIEPYREFIAKFSATEDPQVYTVEHIETGQFVGIVPLGPVVLANRVLETGALYSPMLQRTIAATEAAYLAVRKAFDEGYRRVEWKCDSLNAASCRAATRFGYSFEGILRQHKIIDGRNRDTAWYSIIDREWPSRRAALEKWMDPRNFDADGRQKLDLATIRKSIEREEPGLE